MTIIGTKKLDERIFIGTLETETLSDEELRAEIETIEAEIGEIPTPELISNGNN